MTRHPTLPSETSSSGGRHTPPPPRSISPRLRGLHASSRRHSPSPLRTSSLPPNSNPRDDPDDPEERLAGSPFYADSVQSPGGADGYEMHSLDDRPTGGQTSVPLLVDKNGYRDHGSNGQPVAASKRNALHAQPDKYPEPVDQTRRKYIYAAIFLLIALVSFVVQTETSVYIQHTLHWNKAYCMLWLTHGSWVFLWPTQLLILRVQNRKQSWKSFWRRHKALLRTTAQMVQHQDLHLTGSKMAASPWPYMIKTTAYVTTFLTFAGASWYVAIDLTSPSDLTAIYNCSAFFAYVFSIGLLKDKVRLDKVFSVGLAVAGVLVVAYGDTENPDSHPKTPGHSGGSTNPNPESPPNNRFLGNIIIGVGSVLYGLYEVLYKKFGCPPDGTAPNRGMIFANTFGSFIGAFTLCVLWIPLPILHFTGLERFELPSGEAAWYLAISTLSNATFSGSFLVLMSLTSPVLSSVAALLTIFLVAITDWILTGIPLSKAALLGGILIIVAFLMLSWATYREMKEEAIKREREEGSKVVDDGDDDLDLSDDTHDAGESEGLVDGDELDPERGTRPKHKRKKSTVLVKGDQDDWEEVDDELGEEVGASGFRQKRRHRES